MRCGSNPILPTSFKKKVGVDMNKRPYYVIWSYVDDCNGDGQSFDIEYIGCNLAAAKNRLRFIYDKLKTYYFIDRGVDAQYIEEIPPEAATNYTKKSLNVNQCIDAYINDGDEIYVGAHLKCIHLNEFILGGREEQYKALFPNTKY